MSILVEIADRADSTVEEVVRVLTREPVAAAARERVLAVLDELGGEEARILERFALAALHDAVPPQAEQSVLSDQPDQADQPDRPDPGARADDSGAAVARVAGDGSSLGVTPDDVPRKDALTEQVGLLLEELVEAVKEIRREGLADRQERIDDLAVLVELLTTGWRRVDRRLGRVERLVERLEADRPVGGVPFEAGPVRAAPIRTDPAPIEAAPIEAAPIESGRIEEGRSVSPPAAAPSEPKRPWLPLTAILVLLVAGGLAILAFDLLPSSSDRPRLLTDPESASAPSIRTSPTTTASSSTAPTRASPPSASTAGTSTPGASTPRASVTTKAPSATKPARTSPAPATTRARPRVSTPQQGARRPRTTVSTPTAPRPRTTTAPTATAPRGTTTGSTGFQPARDFVWTPADGADYYAVRFLRDGALFYQARPTRPRLTVPRTLVFRPGSYRWVVRPGFGAPAENRVGAPVVDSRFSVVR